MAAILNAGELTLSGDVGDAFFDDGFTYSEVVLALAQIDDDADLVVRLNSGGGYAAEGAAIEALLSRRAGRTDVVIDGIAASAASLIAMAGESVTMTDGAVMMIHDPLNITIGNSADHAKTIEQLEALATAYSRVYARKSGKTAEECRDVMKAETWFTAEEAIQAGFADDPSDEKSRAVAAFDYRAYAHAPQRLRALAAKKNWRLPDTSAPAASAAQSTSTGDDPMGDKERADQLAAELAEIKKNQPDVAKAAADAVKADRERRASIMALEETKGREKLAERLSATTMSLDDVKATLADAPKAIIEDDATAHEQRRLNGEGLNGGNPGATASKAAGILANYRAVTGAKASA